MQTASEGREILPNVTVLMSYMADGNKKSLIHKDKARFPMFAVTLNREPQIKQ